MIEYQKTKDLLNDGYVVLDGGFIIDHHLYCHFNYLSQTGVEKVYKKTLKEDNEEWYQELFKKEDFFVKRYKTSSGKNCVGVFKKLKDKYENSVFLNEMDKSLISNITLLITNKNEPVKLGDFIHSSSENGRIVWVKREFMIYDDQFNRLYNIKDLDNVTKIN